MGKSLTFDLVTLVVNILTDNGVCYLNLTGYAIAVLMLFCFNIIIRNNLFVCLVREYGHILIEHGVILLCLSAQTAPIFFVK